MSDDETWERARGAQRRLHEAADSARRAAAGLGAVAGLVMWRSEAASRFRSTADEAADGLRRAAARCEDAVSDLAVSAGGGPR